ncbi:hypothetical protein Adt_26510 [Abeliophyllum distichum]|uniref:Uncharacterized protein n=1 Tax=Abeliophyllum distichum TaxID=126358 RepID=A0ABD1RSY0_9LAMI
MINTHDSHILAKAIYSQDINFPEPRPDKYYLVDFEFTNRPENGPEEIQNFERCAGEEAKGNAIVKADEVEVEELRNAIEKEIHQLSLEQAEIEAACRIPFEFDDDCENEMDLRIGENENREEENWRRCRDNENEGNVYHLSRYT